MGDIKEDIKLDRTDKRILNLLIENSRLSYRQIAKKLKVATATVISRMNRFKESGAIKSYSVNLDYEKLGFDVQVIIDVRVSKGKLFQVEKKIAKHPNVFAVYDNTGGFDATIIAKFHNRRAMDSFLKHIQSYDFVERTQTKFILNTFKEEQVCL